MASISATTAVGWVVSPIIKMMVSKVQSYISSQYNWNSGLKSDLENLKVTSTEMLTAIEAAEKRTVVDRNQDALRLVKAAACDAEDVLDKFDYMLLKEKINHQRMVTYIASSSLSCVKRYIGLDKLKPELQKVIKSVTKVRACAEMIVRVMAVENTNNSIQSLEYSARRVTGSVLHEDSIFGRKEEVDELVAVLLKQSDDLSSPDGRGSSIPEVHSVTGIGGIGKTTVAQLIYNDSRIADTFNLRM